MDIISKDIKVIIDNGEDFMNSTTIDDAPKYSLGGAHDSSEYNKPESCVWCSDPWPICQEFCKLFT